VLGIGRGRKEQARRGWNVGSPLCLAAKTMCVCSWDLCFSSCLLSMSQLLAPWQAAPQKAGLPRPGDPPRYLHLLDLWDYAAGQRWEGEVRTSLLWLLSIHNVRFPCLGRPQCP